MKKTTPEKVEYSQEEHDQLCTAADYNPWTYVRTACTFKAEQHIGDGRYIDVRQFRFCRYHWHDFRTQAEDEIFAGGSLDFLLDRLIQNERWQIVTEERQRIREELKREVEQERAHARRLRELRDEQRRLERDSAALAADLLGEESCVYFVQIGKRGPIKIGYTRDVAKRLDALQTGNPHRLRLLATVAGTTRTEADYHRMFAEHRLSGEWFKPVPAIRQEIKTISRIKGQRPDALF